MTKPTLESAYTAPRPMPDAMNGSRLITNANFWSSAGHPARRLNVSPGWRSYRRDCVVSAHSAYAIRTLPTRCAVRLLVVTLVGATSEPAFRFGTPNQTGPIVKVNAAIRQSRERRLTKSRDLITLSAKQQFAETRRRCALRAGASLQGGFHERRCAFRFHAFHAVYAFAGKSQRLSLGLGGFSEQILRPKKGGGALQALSGRTRACREGRF